MSKINNSQKGRPSSTFGNTYSTTGIVSPSKPSDMDQILHREFEHTSPDHMGMHVDVDMRFNMEKCSNSADLPSTQNHKGASLGDV
jgi:hypothetical protein